MTDTTPPPDRPPLWRVMQDAYFKGRGPGCNEAHGYAAELRAVADAVVPEEDLHEFTTVYFVLPRDIAAAKWAARYEIRALLLAEAERAEEGEP